jgi:hypothetical protein
MSDPTQSYRRKRTAELAAEQTDNRAELEERHGQVFDPSELHQSYEVQGFMAPYVILRERATGKLGSMEFQHSPRYYWGFQADE